MIIEKFPVSPWGAIESCIHCNGKLLLEYFIGIQTFNATCETCRIFIDAIDDYKYRYEVRYHWGEHVGQNHTWIRSIVDLDGTIHEETKHILNEYQ